jgi:PAS domain S-box-containing protein
MIVASVKLGNDKRYSHLCLIQDITKRKSIEKALLESERSKSMLLSNLPGMAYRCNYDFKFTMKFVSQGFFELTGYTPDSLINNRVLSFMDMVISEYRDAIRQEWWNMLARNLPFRYEYEIMTADGQRKWVLDMGQGVFDDEGNVVALEGIVIDITERKKQEDRLRQLSETDSLTGLYNRHYLENLLAEDSINKWESKRALVVLSLRRINSISLTYGYYFSENLIKEVAVRLADLAKDNIKLFQISFERFAFYLENYKDKSDLSYFCSSIIEEVGRIRTLQTIGCGIGVLEINSDKCEPETLIKNASAAAELADKSQPFGCRCFDNELKARVIREMGIKDELMKAAYDEKNESIFLHYQPILDVKSNRIKGFEALARFKCGKLGVVPPSEFIPLAEETQLIVPLGRRIIHMACCFLKRLESIGYDGIKISVNISAIQLLRDEFIADLTEMLKEHQVKPGNMGIEITESVFADNFKALNEKLRILTEMGLVVSIDDFGTGYSSLARGRELNINSLKIDKSFIDRLLTVRPEEAITADIISMAHKLGHCVVAEGVEYEEQRRYLDQNGCDMVQGYLFSKPIDEDAAVDILKYNLDKKLLSGRMN